MTFDEIAGIWTSHSGRPLVRDSLAHKFAQSLLARTQADSQAPVAVWQETDKEGVPLWGENTFADGLAVGTFEHARPLFATSQAPVAWREGVGMLWDIYSQGKFSKKVVSPLGWDAWSVYRHMVDVGKFAPHIDVRLAVSQPIIAPSVAHRGGDAVHQGRTIGDKAWVDLSYDAFSHMRNKPQIFETQILYRSATPAVQTACDRDAGYAQGYRDGYLEACPNCGHVKGGEPDSGEAKS